MNFKYEHFIIIILITSFSYGCGNGLVVEKVGIIENDFLTIKPQDELKQVDFISKIDSVKFVELEFGDESIIVDISKVEVFEDRIYVLDPKSSSLFVFDIDGNFIFKINSIGNGPGEYAQLDYFDLDYNNREIVLTDLMSYWIMRYDLSGNYISRKKIPFWCEGVAPVHDKGAVLFANYRSNSDKFVQEYNLNFLDSLMENSKSYFPYDSKIYNNPRVRFSTPTYGPFYTYNGQRNFFTLYGNMIYHLEKDSLKPKYKIDFGEKNFDSTLYDKPLELSAYMENGEYNLLGSVFETDVFLLFSFYNSKNPTGIKCYFDKRSRNSYSGVAFKVGENAYLPGLNIGAFDDYFISVVRPSSIISWREDIDTDNLEINDNFSKTQYEFSTQLQATDNPVLMMYRLK